MKNKFKGKAKKAVVKEAIAARFAQRLVPIKARLSPAECDAILDTTELNYADSFDRTT